VKLIAQSCRAVQPAAIRAFTERVDPPVRKCGD
jgi:hypothetical protein